MIKKNEWYNAPTQCVMLGSVAKTCTCGSAVCALVSGSVCDGCRHLRHHFSVPIVVP